MSELKRTPLFDEHLAAGAKIVPFAGYEMPVQYTSLMDEHRAVREAAGLFDVSHMGQFHFRGPQAAAFLDHLTPSRVSAVPVGRAVYTALTTETGCFVDDILAYHVGEEHFLVVVNAANKKKDFAWIASHRAHFAIEFDDASDRGALIAIQGPKARRIVARIAEGFDGLAVKYYRVVAGKIAGHQAIASRTGYTGEMGYEIFVAAESAPAVWKALLAAGAEDGIQPAGLGARDSLRLEAALPLYGNDIDETTSVLEAGLEFTIDWDKSDFIGMDVLRHERETGSARRRVGFEIAGRGIARQGHRLFDGERDLGPVGSGSWSPTLKKAIGMGYLPLEYNLPGKTLEVEVRGRRLPAVVTPMPFYRRPKAKKKGA